MTGDIDDLRDIYMEVSDGETITESQRDGPSHDPVEPGEASLGATGPADGLGEALEGAAEDAMEPVAD